MQKNDYQILELPHSENPFTLYQWDGKAWRYQRVSFATPEEELAFVAERNLTLVEQLTVGVWPARLYRR